jgi:hypothetical protein
MRPLEVALARHVPDALLVVIALALILLAVLGYLP